MLATTSAPRYIRLTGAVVVDRAAGRHFEGRDETTGQRGYWFAADLACLARRERDGQPAVTMPVRTAAQVRDI